MNNYMQQIADMLGVELGEVFYVSWERNSKQKFTLSDDGLYQIKYDGIEYDGLEEGFGVKSDKVLMRILTGEAKIIKRPWKPDVNGDYYKVYKFNDERVYVEHVRWLGAGNSENLADWKIGNCFETEEEAKTKGLSIIEQIESEFKKA
nr:MAG TPA: hypothetical protein [Caudoviricetes sp.]